MKRIPKYKIIEDYIKEEISCQNLKPGDQIMTEEQLAERFNFSRMTISKAINQLVEQGYIKRTPGRGSFVRAPKVSKSLYNGSSFTEDMESIGLKAESKLLSYQVLKGSEIPEVAEKLSLSEDDYIHYFIRLRSGSGTPIAISYTYISALVIPAIEVSCLDGSFYEFVRKLGIGTSRMDSEVRAIMPTQEQKELLDIDNSSLLAMTHLTYTEIDGNLIPFEYIHTYYNGDLYTYRFHRPLP
jgi:Transcriptional regulators